MQGERSAGDSKPQTDEDKKAILSRRQFLIASSLAGAGIGVAVTGCHDRLGVCFSVPNPFFQPCLSIDRPRSEGEPPESDHPSPTDPPRDEQEPSPRFGPVEPDSRDQTESPKTDQEGKPQPPNDFDVPQVCLHFTRDANTVPPQVCLSVTAPARRLPPVP